MNEGERKLDTPVIVILVSEDIASIKPHDVYFVFKDIIEKDAVENWNASRCLRWKKGYFIGNNKQRKIPYKTDKKVIIVFLDEAGERI